MSKRKGKSRKKREPFFQPSEIMTKIKEALLGDYNGPSYEQMDQYDPVHSAHWNQITNFDKKFEFDGNDKNVLEQLTYRRFLKVNDHMAKFRGIPFPDPNQRIQSTTDKRTKILLRARALCQFVLDDITEDEWFQNCKHGSGSSIGVPYSDTSLERKFTFPITMTEQVRPLFYRYLAFDPQLQEQVNLFNSYFPFREAIQIVEGSQAFTVNKDNTIRRMACKEPTWNMYLQQGLMLTMYNRLCEVGLDVKRLPEYHQLFEKTSCLTRRKATMYWSSASDCTMHELL